MNQPLVNNNYRLSRFPGKGGWTYALIPEIAPDKKSHFGWVRVRGSIDRYVFKNVHLMPLGNGQLFLPVKSSVRKEIGKQAGDMVHIILYPDQSPVEIPPELEVCLRDEPQAWLAFTKLSPGEKKAAIDRIYSARKEDTKVNRIAGFVNKLKFQNQEGIN